MSGLVFCVFSGALCGSSPERQNSIQLKGSADKWSVPSVIAALELDARLDCGSLPVHAVHGLPRRSRSKISAAAPNRKIRLTKHRTDFSGVSGEEVQRVYDAISRRPRKRMEFRTLYEVHYSEVLHLL